MNETVDAKQKEIKQQNPGAETTALSTAVRKKSARGMESLDNRVNKVGIRYHNTDDTSALRLNGHVTALVHCLINQIM